MRAPIWRPRFPSIFRRKPWLIPAHDDQLLAAIEEFKKDEDLADRGIRLIPVYNQGDFIRKSINDVNSSLLFGSFLQCWYCGFFCATSGQP